MTEVARTVSEALEVSADRGTGGLAFHSSGTTADFVSARQLRRDADVGAARLAELGVKPGDRVGVLGPNSPEWARWAFSVWRLGGVLVPLGFPLLMRDRSALKEQLRSLIRAAHCVVVLAVPEMQSAVPRRLARDWAWQPVSSDDPAVGLPVPTDPESHAVVQFTSGGTAFPKGAVLTHRAILSGLANMGIAYRTLGQAERYVGWLPFFHDNGLIGYLVRPVLAGSRAELLPTELFVRDMAQWFRLATASGATFTSGPPSAWSAALRAARSSPSGIDLSSLRLGILAAETIDPDLVDRLQREGPELGLRSDALTAAYGLAEATLAVTAGEPGRGIRIDQVDLQRLASSGEAAPAAGGITKGVVSCGRPIPGVELRLVRDGMELPERLVGEIQVRSPALMEGYLTEGHLDSSSPFAEGWLRTGDLGYMADGELFFTGRRKDVIVVLGRNYPPEDIEWAAQRVPGVLMGRCVAFGPEGAREGQVAVALESSPDASPALPRRVQEAVFDAVGIRPSEVFVVPKGTIPKTTSGKLRRAAMKEMEASGLLSPP